MAARLLTLPTGRVLEFAEYGDLHGHPALVFHGLIGSHHQASWIAETAAARGLRLIAPNRPGVGRSEFVPRTRVTQAVDDLENFRRFVERAGTATGGWRGSINVGADLATPGVADAAASLGDSGKVSDPAAYQASFRDDEMRTPGLGGPGMIGEPDIPADYGPYPRDARADDAPR